VRAQSSKQRYRKSGEPWPFKDSGHPETGLADMHHEVTRPNRLGPDDIYSVVFALCGVALRGRLPRVMLPDRGCTVVTLFEFVAHGTLIAPESTYRVGVISPRVSDIVGDRRVYRVVRESRSPKDID